MRATHDETIGPVSSAPFGSASILPIPWMYITMMGGRGLTEATEAAILHANYIARRLEAHYPVLYTGPSGLVAHECILDLRPLKATAGIEAEDVAKRLIDYGFHAPTMSFPGCRNADGRTDGERVVARARSLRRRDDRDPRGDPRDRDRSRRPRGQRPQARAAHGAAVSADAWTHAYTRRVAAYPTVAQEHAKYWPPVARIDNVYGDRNLFCTCIPVDAYEEAAPAAPA